MVNGYIRIVVVNGSCVVRGTEVMAKNCGYGGSNFSSELVTFKKARLDSLMVAQGLLLLFEKAITIYVNSDILNTRRRSRYFHKPTDT